jgi:predicted dehydrogenase
MSKPSRRFFFASSALALRAAAAAPPPSDVVRIGMIGMGGRGTAIMTSDMKRVPNLRLTHLCDVDQARLEKAQAAADKAGYGRVRGSADLRRVLEDKEVDAVIVATPDHWHAPATILACSAGKDVYVEKPVSHNLREGRLMVEAARKYQRVVQAGMQSRSRPSTMKAVEIAHSNTLGRVLMAKAWNSQLRAQIGRRENSPVPAGVDYDTWVGPAEMVPFNENRFHYKWHWHWNFGTGDMGNDGAHQLDIARWALRTEFPERVSGSGAKYFFDDDQQTPDTMNLSFDYGGKGLLWEMRIWHDYGLEGIDNGVAVYGTEGFLHIGRWNRTWGYRVFDKAGKLMTEEQDPSPEFHMQNFIDCVISRRRPNCDIEIGHVSNAHCHLGNIVHRTGRNVRFHAATESIPGDAEANALLRRKYRNHWAAPKGV